MYNRIFFILFIIFTGQLFSQNSTGIVLDSKKGRPLSGCIVIVKGSTVSAITDNHGHFSIDLPADIKKPALVFTMLGYVTAEFTFSTYKKDTFYLTQKDIQLKTVEIAAEQKAVLNPKSEDVIIDFDILNDDLIFLIAGHKNNTLKLMDLHGEPIAKLKVNSQSLLLKRDCIGNLQLMSDDSAWQIFYDFEKLNSLHPYSLLSYEKIMGSCVCSNDNNFYFQNRSYRNLRTNYFYFSEKDKGIKHDLVSFGDTAKIRSFELDYNLQFFLDVRRRSHYTMYNEPVDSMKQHLQQYREELPLDWAYQSWLGKVETDMVKKDTNVFIVNFTDSLIYHVKQNNTLELQSRFYIRNYKDLIHKVYVDTDNNDTYIIQFLNNKLVVIRFDIDSGKELAKTEIPEIPYLPHKIIIHGGSVYFVQKNLADQQTYKLIRFYLNS